MSLNAQVRTDALGNITIYMHGDLNHDYNTRLKKELLEISTQHPHSTITIDMHSLDFVGSSGISKFVKLLQDLYDSNPHKYKISNVKSEFLKVFEIYNFNAFEMIMKDYESDQTNSKIISNGRNSFPN